MLHSLLLIPFNCILYIYKWKEKRHSLSPQPAPFLFSFCSIHFSLMVLARMDHFLFGVPTPRTQVATSSAASRFGGRSSRIRLAIRPFYQAGSPARSQFVSRAFYDSMIACNEDSIATLHGTHLSSVFESILFMRWMQVKKLYCD